MYMELSNKGIAARFLNHSFHVDDERVSCTLEASFMDMTFLNSIGILIGLCWNLTTIRIPTHNTNL
jgi:hypothetical protein